MRGIYAIGIIFAIMAIIYCSGCLETTYGIENIKLLQDSKGEYWLLWEMSTDEPVTYTIWMSKSQDGINWSDPKLFASYHSSNPSMIEDSSGTYRIVWAYEIGNGSIDGIWMAYSKDGINWNNVKIINNSECINEDMIVNGLGGTIEGLKIFEESNSTSLRVFWAKSSGDGNYTVSYIQSQNGMNWSLPKRATSDDMQDYRKMENCMVPEKPVFPIYDVVQNQEGKCMRVDGDNLEIFVTYSEDGINWGNISHILTASKAYEKEPLIKI
ncbi:MAG: hypothetical protein CVT88_05745 [Candidatus Altiarchaeales archaeon HGW-Altiarchaeales-1]|nr:MAG: hypothetical protein CVT88_05745 [Candidatus Altiarchaeales archaeon HGW-Altiarchaeales-1]